MAGDPHVSAAKPAVIAMVLLAAAAAAFVAIRVAVTGPAGVPDRFRFDDAKYRKTDPALVIYKETGRIETGMAEPRGVAVDAAGNVLVVGDSTLAAFGSDGTEVSRTPLAAEPTCVAVAAEGAIYVGMRDHIQVYRGLRGPLPRPAWGSLGPEAIITSVAVLGTEVFVFDAGNKMVFCFDSLGYIHGRFDEGKYRLVVYQPCGDLASFGEDLLLVTNPGRMRVETYTTAGEMTGFWGEGTPAIEGFSPCCNPVNIAVLPDGSVVTAEKNIPRVKVYGSSGRFIGVVAGAEEFGDSKGLIDVAADAEGRVLVLDPAAKAVRIFERKSDKPGKPEKPKTDADGGAE
ncbi:MAG: NHL repeat-containing protein [Planctomycetota bacterium]|jgi:hypothetical protein